MHSSNFDSLYYYYFKLLFCDFSSRQKGIGGSSFCLKIFPLFETPRMQTLQDVVFLLRKSEFLMEFVGYFDDLDYYVRRNEYNNRQMY